MHEKDPTSTARRRELHEMIVIEAAAMFVALDRQVDAEDDPPAAAAQERRFVRAQLVLADLCGSVSAYYREGSTTHVVASLAAAALGWAAWRHPELVGELRAALAAERAIAAGAPSRRFADVCPPHRTTDAEYAEWVANVVSTFDGMETPHLKADVDSRRAWRDEAATWSAWLAAQTRLGSSHGSVNVELTDAGRRARAALESAVGGAR